jgi:hypothetical protein
MAPDNRVSVRGVRFTIAQAHIDAMVDWLLDDRAQLD